MKLLHSSWTEAIWTTLRSSIVIRTTLVILALCMILGMTVGSIVSVRVDSREQEGAETRLQELLSTIERTAQIACYLKDSKLAAEIAQGLIRNRAVSGVSITSGNITLSQIGRTLSTQSGHIGGSVIAMRIYSPFEPREPVGNVSLYVDRAVIHADASRYSHTLSLAMGLQAALVAAGVAVAVYFFWVIRT